MWGPGIGGAFVRAAQATAGRIVGDGWAEHQWVADANAQGPLGGSSYLELHRQASSPVPYGAPGASRRNAYLDGSPVWENAPGVSGDVPGAHDGGGDPA